jgi:hypothetical protein
MSRVTINQLPEPVKRGQVHPKDYWVGSHTLSAMVSLARTADPVWLLLLCSSAIWAPRRICM